MVLTINSDCFPKQHQPIRLCSEDVMCFLWGTNCIYIYILRRRNSVLKELSLGLCLKITLRENERLETSQRRKLKNKSTFPSHFYLGQSVNTLFGWLTNQIPSPKFIKDVFCVNIILHTFNFPFVCYPSRGCWEFCLSSRWRQELRKNNVNNSVHTRPVALILHSPTYAYILTS
jgi:hypothetical protein